MSKVYFISDAHLGLGTKDEERAKEDRLIVFLGSIRKDATQLFILGDLFDAWIEYRTVIPKGFHRILTSLHELVRSGVAVHYLVGNHDFWIRNYFSEELGMRTYHMPFDVLIDGKKVFVHHGDGLAKKDSGYRILKKVINNRFSIWLYSWVHPDVGIALARSSSRKSRGYTSTKEYGKEDGMMEFSRRKIEEGFDIVVMGHRHEPVCKEFGRGQYVNLGDWIRHNTYAVMENGRMELKQWQQ